jgi:hypothetical protein
MKEDTLRKYYESPNLCLTCKKVIEVKDGQKLSEVLKKKFCDRTCSAIYNNSKRVKTVKRTDRPRVQTKDQVLHCERCRSVLLLEKKNGRTLSKKYCPDCRRKIQSEIAHKAFGNGNGDIVENCSKTELRNKRKDWNNFRASVSKHARGVYKKSGKPYVCAVCSFDAHVQVCHKVSVSEFPDTTLISEINSIDNLVALCPNHHWLLDHGRLTKQDLGL